jgi:hypothetical protein
MSSLPLPRLSSLFAAVAILLFAGAMLFPSVSHAQSEDASPEERAKVRVFEALDLMDVGSYGEARLVLQLALGLNAALDRAWYYLAQCNVELGNWDEALEALSKYEAAELSEHERMQIVELRSKIQTSRDAANAEVTEADDTAQASVGGNRRKEAVTEPAATATAAPEKGSPVAVKKPVPGEVLMIAGGILAGIGAGVWVAGAVMSQGQQATHEQGKPIWYTGVAMTAGGGACLAIGIPLTIKAKKNASRVALSIAPDAVNPSAGVYLMGQW